MRDIDHYGYVPFDEACGPTLDALIRRGLVVVNEYAWAPGQRFVFRAGKLTQ